MKHPLNEAWDGMVREGVLDSVVNSVKSTLSTDPQQQQNGNKQVDPNKLKQIEVLKQQVRDIDTKIAPLADKKRKLEDQISKLMK